MNTKAFREITRSTLKFDLRPMKTIQSLAILGAVVVTLLGATTASGVTITVGTSENWSAITTGSGTGGQPAPTDSIIVSNTATLTVNLATAQCASIQLGATSGSGTGTLLFNSGSQVTVSGTVTVGGGTGRGGSINMTSGGTLIANSLAVTTAGT